MLHRYKYIMDIIIINEEWTTGNVNVIVYTVKQRNTWQQRNSLYVRSNNENGNIVVDAVARWMGRGGGNRLTFHWEYHNENTLTSSLPLSSSVESLSITTSSWSAIVVGCVRSRDAGSESVWLVETAAQTSTVSAADAFSSNQRAFVLSCGIGLDKTVRRRTHRINARHQKHTPAHHHFVAFYPGFLSDFRSILLLLTLCLSEDEVSSALGIRLQHTEQHSRHVVKGAKSRRLSPTRSHGPALFFYTSEERTVVTDDWQVRRYSMFLALSYSNG